MTAILPAAAQVIEAFWKSTIVLGAALLAVTLLRKASADLRRLILTTAILTLFAMAAAMFALPRWTAEIPAVPPPPVVITQTAQFQMTTAAIAIPSATSKPTPTARRTPDFLAALWLAIATLLLARFFTNLYSLRRLRRASQQIGATNNFPILQSDAASAPVTWGILHPVILVPPNFEQLPEESRAAILEHELAHIQSHDFFFRTLAEIARAILWFQPLIWIARRRLREEQELACDDRVLETGASPSSYAKLLLNWNAGPEIAVGMAHRSCLKKRLYALLDPDLRRNRVPSKIALATSLLALAASIPLAALTFSHPVVEPPVIIRAIPVPPPQTFPTAPPRPVQLAQNRPAAAPTATPVTLAPQLTVNAVLVITDVSVIDKATSKAVEGLGVNDFTLTEDGAPQTITLCELESIPVAGRDSISSYYVLGYYPANQNVDGTYRRTVVGLKDATLAASSKLDYRAGYYQIRKFVRIDGTAIDGTAIAAPETHPESSAGPGAAPAPGVTPPVLISRRDPEYSEQARKAKYSGSVTLNLTVDETGKVIGVSVVKNLGMGLDQKAVEAVQQWKFRPGTRNGKPVTTQAEVTVNFRLL